ncbi:hypothetical protein ACIA5C_33560 [Actinoplanes sp. NPDC051343]|uniref:hypothetical protein n=1 Tax=Actinoplanes sp. NPDC051343 TaxID=3363906 RepID=UPI0037883C4A
MPKWTTLGVGVAAVLALAACKPDSAPAPATSASAPSAGPPASPSAQPSVQVPADPGKALLAAAGRLGAQPFKLKFSALGQEATGSIDLSARTSEIDTLLQNGATISVRQLGTDQYVQVTGDSADALHATPGKWMHADTKGLPATNPLSPDHNQAASAAKLLKDASAVRRTADGTYSGKADLSHGAAQLPSSLTGKLKAVPFTARLDPQGRLTSLIFDMNSVLSGAGELNTAYYDYGVPVSVARPAATETVPMPDAFKKAIGLG